MNDSGGGRERGIPRLNGSSDRKDLKGANIKTPKNLHGFQLFQWNQKAYLDQKLPPPLPPPAKSHAEFLKLKIHQRGLNDTTQNSLSIIPTENIPIKKTPE